MIEATTILAIRHQNRTVLAGDGQVTLGTTVLKHGARKIRRLYNESILAGFAGSAADSFALFSRFESKLEQYRGNLERASVELARDWRTDRLLRRLGPIRPYDYPAEHRGHHNQFVERQPMPIFWVVVQIAIIVCVLISAVIVIVKL